MYKGGVYPFAQPHGLEDERMMNAGNKRLILLLLALSMLVCGVMALGSTFATQVNKSDGLDKQYIANNDNNLNYKINLTYHTIEDETPKPFLTSAPFTSAPWCPGYTKVVYLTIKNNEAFPVECILTIDDGDSELGKVMSYAVIDTPDASYNNWDDFKKDVDRAGHLADENPTVFNYPATSPLTAGQTATYALAIHMDEEANNTHQNQTMNMTFKLKINADYSTGYDPNANTNDTNTNP